MPKKYYISDCHFGHGNIIGFDGRPFKDRDEMDDFMIQQWNKVVTKNDEVYIIGDMFMGHPKDMQLKILNKLNGMKHLIEGNHDRKNAEVYKRYQSVSQIKEVKDGNYKIVLCHYPILVYNGHYNDRVFHFYGHVHNTHEEEMTQAQRELMLKYELGYSQMLNVGAMMPYMNYQPKTFDELYHILQGLQ